MSSSGLVSAVATGTVTVKASDPDTGVEGEATVTVVKAAMVISNAGPWGQISKYQDGMNQVFGTGKWDQINISTATGDIFAEGSIYGYIYIDGSDSDGVIFNQYLTNNLTSMENWVNSGGHLYVNEAANSGPTTVNAPFGATLVSGNPCSSVTATDSSHSIFNGPFTPAGPNYTGSSFSHNKVEGTGLTKIIVKSSDPTLTVLAESTHEKGLILYGGITSDVYHQLQPNAHNLFKNILTYGAGL